MTPAELEEIAATNGTPTTHVERVIADLVAEVRRLTAERDAHERRPADAVAGATHVGVTFRTGPPDQGAASVATSSDWVAVPRALLKTIYVKCDAGDDPCDLTPEDKSAARWQLDPFHWGDDARVVECVEAPIDGAALAAFGLVPRV